MKIKVDKYYVLKYKKSTEFYKYVTDYEEVTAETPDKALAFLSKKHAEENAFDDSKVMLVKKPRIVDMDKYIERINYDIRSDLANKLSNPDIWLDK